MIVRNFNLHLNAGVSSPLVIHANQYDHYEQWVFTLYTEKGELYVPSTGAIIGVKSDGHGIINTATVNENGQVVVNETQQMTAASGMAMFELSIDDGAHGTANFYVDVEKKPGDNADLSDSDLSLIQQAVDSAANIHDAAQLVDVVETLNGRVENIISTNDKIDKYVIALAEENWRTSGGKYIFEGELTYSDPPEGLIVINAGWNTSSNGEPTEWQYEGVTAGYDGTKINFKVVSDTNPFATDTNAYIMLTTLTPSTFSTGTPSEVADIRVPASGMTVPTGGYSRAGDAVRGQISELKSQIESGTGSGLTEDVKLALMDIAEHIGAWTDGNAQTYVENLRTALFPPVELESISARYTQSGVIYDIASLDDLKTNLVVTAQYDNGTSEAVTRYDLSGTLTEGTSEITVSYREKTATFNVNVTRSLPSGYTKYDYLVHTSSGSKAQTYMIKLATYPNLNRISLDMKVKVLSVLGGYAIIGGRSESGTVSSFAFYAHNTITNGALTWHLHGVDTAFNIPFAINQIHSLKYTATTESPSIIDVDGETYDVEWENDNTIDRFLTLLANPVSTNNNRISEDIQIGRIIVKDENGDVLNRYIPCVQDSSQKIGMYDMDSQTFYTPSKAGVAVIGNSACIYQVGNWA